MKLEWTCNEDATIFHRLKSGLESLLFRCEVVMLAFFKKERKYHWMWGAIALGICWRFGLTQASLRHPSRQQIPTPFRGSLTSYGRRKWQPIGCRKSDTDWLLLLDPCWNYSYWHILATPTILFSTTEGSIICEAFSLHHQKATQ